MCVRENIEKMPKHFVTQNWQKTGSFYTLLVNNSSNASLASATECIKYEIYIFYIEKRQHYRWV